jgi:hypothetical protein
MRPATSVVGTFETSTDVRGSVAFAGQFDGYYFLV